ncbi:CHAP domain-containing protein [Sorangium sp. So ce281]|uniref:CHAP domain-containing protein n=1 Tax=unclassified Sorangium TaxID=2621164 RepID=UPI003F5DA4A6
MANTARAMLDKCRSYLGYKENSNNDTMFGEWYGLNHQPWCAMFISYCAAKTKNDDVIPRYASCEIGADWFKVRGQFSSNPTVGSIVFYGARGGTHTEIVEAVDGSTITTIGGNTNNDGSANGDGVYRRRISRRSISIHGYGHPEYKKEDIDMPKRVSLARKGKMTLKIDSWEVISFTTEYSDHGDMHPADGASFIQGPAHYMATAAAEISGLVKGTTLQSRFVEVTGTGAGTVEKYGPIQEHVVTAGATFITQTRAGAVCDDGNRVQWRIVVADGSVNGILESAEVQAHYWAI